MKANVGQSATNNTDNAQLSGILEIKAKEAEGSLKKLVEIEENLETVKKSKETISKRYVVAKRHFNAAKKKISEISMMDPESEQVSSKSKCVETELSGVENPMISISGTKVRSILVGKTRISLEAERKDILLKYQS